MPPSRNRAPHAELAELGLSVSIRVILDRLGIRTIQSLQSHTEAQLRAMSRVFSVKRRLGTNRLAAIDAALVKATGSGLARPSPTTSSQDSLVDNGVESRTLIG